jgi:hypothetical protein
MKIACTRRDKFRRKSFFFSQENLEIVLVSKCIIGFLGEEPAPIVSPIPIKPCPKLSVLSENLSWRSDRYNVGSRRAQ